MGATFGTYLYTMFSGKYVGRDEFGNKYYRSRCKKSGNGIGRRNTERRWVIYKGIAEPSKVPASWHGWLHHMVDDLPTNLDGKGRKTHKWSKEHIPNLTGTDYAYHPAKPLKKGQEAANKATSYKAWSPEG